VCQAILALMSDRRGYNSLARMYTLELAMPR